MMAEYKSIWLDGIQVNLKPCFFFHIYPLKNGYLMYAFKRSYIYNLHNSPIFLSIPLTPILEPKLDLTYIMYSLFNQTCYKTKTSLHLYSLPYTIPTERTHRFVFPNCFPLTEPDIFLSQSNIVELSMIISQGLLKCQLEANIKILGVCKFPLF